MAEATADGPSVAVGSAEGVAGDDDEEEEDEEDDVV